MNNSLPIPNELKFFDIPVIDCVLDQPNGPKLFTFLNMLVNYALCHDNMLSKNEDGKTVPLTDDDIKKKTKYFSPQFIRRALKLFTQLRLFGQNENGIYTLGTWYPKN